MIICQHYWEGAWWGQLMVNDNLRTLLGGAWWGQLMVNGNLTTLLGGRGGDSSW